MNSGKNKNTANRTRPTRQEKRAAKREAKMRRKEALRNAPLSVRIRNGALNVITVCLIGIILVSGYKIGKTMWEYHVAKSAYTNISEKTAKVEEVVAPAAESAEPAATEPEDDTEVE